VHLIFATWLAIEGMGKHPFGLAPERASKREGKERERGRLERRSCSRTRRVHP
jgi:hypothetical protein